VVEVQLNLVGRRRDGLRTSVLDLLNQVLVRVLGEAAALLRVEVHVVNIQRRGREGLGSRCGSRTDARLVVDRVLPRLEVDVDADLVVLERNQGNRKTRVAAEPELERDVERLRGGALASNTRDGGLVRRARRIESKTVRALQEHEVVGVADDGIERLDRARIRGQLGPDLHPVTILAVNALAANFNLNLLDEAVTDVVEPAEPGSGRAASERLS